MSRFDDELRAAASRLAREQLPDALLDPALEQPLRRPTLGLAAAAIVGGALLIAGVVWFSGRTDVPIATGATGSPAAVACDNLPPINARSSEYRVFFPCADGVGMASAPRVGPIANDADLLAQAIRELLAGPTAAERGAGMTAVASASGELLAGITLQPDGLAIVDFDASIADAGLLPSFLDVVGPTALQFPQVTAIELRAGGDCARFFALFSTHCDHIAEPVAVVGACPVIAPVAFASGSGMTVARPYPNDPRAVSWGGGDDTTTERIGEPGGEPFLSEGHTIEIRGVPGFVAEGRPELAWVENDCPYLVVMPAQNDYYLVDTAYAGLFGTREEGPSAPPLAEAPFESASVEEDGVRLSLTLDRSTTAFGERVWAEVVVENVGDDVIHWGHSGSCTWPAGVSVTTDAPVPDLGADWPGDAGVLKRVAIWAADALYFGFLPERFVDQDGDFVCTDDLVADEIQPGQRLTDRFAWDTLGSNGSPPPGGRYVAEATFQYKGRGDISPDADPFEHSLSVRVSLDVAEPSTTYLTPGQAMDALLADSAFIAMLSDAPRERWLAVDLRWVNETYAFELPMDRPTAALVATVDAVTGDVSGVETVDQ